MQLTTLGDVLHWAEQSFESAGLFYGHGTNNAWDEAVGLAMFALMLPPDVDTSVIERVLTPSEKEKLVSLIKTRIETKIPVPYLTHEAWFAGFKFYVDNRVIIPRSPMAELILNGFKPWIGSRPIKRILDLCTGSGCIAIACAKVLNDEQMAIKSHEVMVEVDAVDISTDALEVAAKNVAIHHCQNQVHLMHSDLFEACHGKRYDIIISNPPYVDREEMAALPVEYSFEPSLALEAGNDGLVIVKRILNEVAQYLTPEGLLFVEVGNAMESLEEQFSELPFTWLEFERGGYGVFMLEAKDIC